LGWLKKEKEKEEEERQDKNWSRVESRFYLAEKGAMVSMPLKGLNIIRA